MKYVTIRSHDVEEFNKLLAERAAAGWRVHSFSHFTTKVYDYTIWLEKKEFVALLEKDDTPQTST